MTYQIVIPVYAELPHIESNLESLDDWQHLLLVDNSKTGWLKKFEGRGAKIVYRPENIGVARSWNLGIKEGKDYTFFVSSSVFWPKGFKELADHLYRLIDEKAPGIEWGVFCNLGWHANALSKKCIEKIGDADENFFPAYEEDVDLCYRLWLSGIHPYRDYGGDFGPKEGGTIPIVVIDAQPIEIAVTIKRAGLNVNWAALRTYYISKWGGDHRKETFTTPFNSGRGLGYFPEKTIEQLRKEYEL